MLSGIPNLGRVMTLPTLYLYGGFQETFEYGFFGLGWLAISVEHIVKCVNLVLKVLHYFRLCKYFSVSELLCQNA